MLCKCARWHRDYEEIFDRVASVQQLASRLERVAHECNFERALLILEFPTPFTRRKCTVITHGSPMWVGPIDHEFIAPLRSALTESAMLVDLVSWVLECCPSMLQLPGSTGDEGPVEGRTYTTMANSGVRYSVSFFRSNPMADAQERCSLGVRFRCIGDMVKRAGLRLGLEFSDGFELTPREIDILRWTADGKCSHDVALILGISENTVNYHIKRLLGRSGCSSKLQAVAHAASCKLI